MLPELHFGIVILAAGASSRMGCAKPLLPFKGSSLLGHMLREAEKTKPSVIIVVTGAYPKIAETIENVEIVQNPEWQTGLASSIRTGINEIVNAYPQVEAAIVAVCDQPYLSASVFRGLIAQKTLTGKNIIACAYGGAVGTPVLFSKAYFPALMKLTGDEGARKILLNYAQDIAIFPFEEGAIDIDTPEDYQRVLKETQD